MKRIMRSIDADVQAQFSKEFCESANHGAQQLTISSDMGA